MRSIDWVDEFVRRALPAAAKQSAAASAASQEGASIGAVTVVPGDGASITTLSGALVLGAKFASPE